MHSIQENSQLHQADEDTTQVARPGYEPPRVVRLDSTSGHGQDDCDPSGSTASPGCETGGNAEAQCETGGIASDCTIAGNSPGG